MVGAGFLAKSGAFCSQRGAALQLFLTVAVAKGRAGKAGLKVH